MTRRALTPRILFELLHPAWQLDVPTLDGRWRLHDAYVVHRTSGAVIEILLREGDEALRLTVDPAPHEKGMHAGGLSIAWAAPAPERVGHQACQALAAVLEGAALESTVIERATGPWFVPDDAESDVPPVIAAEVEVVPTALPDSVDHARMKADFVHYDRLYAARPQPCEVRVDGEAVPAVHYPEPTNGKVPPCGALYPVPANFHRRDFRRFMGRLGFALDGTLLRTVPTADGFHQAAARRLGEPPPFSLRFIEGWRGSMTSYSWVRHVVYQHVWPVAVAPRWAVAAHRAIRVAPPLKGIPVDVGMLPHDASLHALGLHAVPHDRWDALTSLARERLRGGSMDLHARLAEFFEGTLTRTAWDVWSDVADPASFVSRFDAQMPELERELRAC